ncbi:LytR/AlgR family response regulator transcription factor [Spirosoma gilvum]
MNVLIVEDELLTAQLLEDLLRQYDPTIQVLATLPSVEESVHWLQLVQSAKYPDPDIIFMDIHLEDEICFRIFDQIQVSAPVIFTTAYDEYMLRAFKVNSIDYLLKPLDFDDLRAAIEKFKRQRKSLLFPQMDSLLGLLQQTKPAPSPYKERFMVAAGLKIRTVATSDIAYFYSEERISYLVTKTGVHLPVDFPLETLITLLDPQHFFRVSRQHIISYDSIITVHAFGKSSLKVQVEPQPRHEVFVSRDRVTDFKIWLGK